MSTLDLIIDSVDTNPALCLSELPSKKSPASRIKLALGKDKPLPRNILAGGTQYSEPKVAAILRDFLQPDTKMSAKTAVVSLLALIPSNASAYAEVCSFGGICVELAEQIPYHHPSQQKLVQLLQSLSRSPKFISTYPLTVGTSYMPRTLNSHFLIFLKPEEEVYQPYQLLWESISDSASGMFNLYTFSTHSIVPAPYLVILEKTPSTYICRS